MEHHSTSTRARDTKRYPPLQVGGLAADWEIPGFVPALGVRDHDVILAELPDELASVIVTGHAPGDRKDPKRTFVWESLKRRADGTADSDGAGSHELGDLVYVTHRADHPPWEQLSSGDLFLDAERPGLLLRCAGTREGLAGFLAIDYTAGTLPNGMPHRLGTLLRVPTDTVTRVIRGGGPR